MLSNHLTQFLRDERGSYTVWSLVWFLIYLGIGGLAVDMTDGYRNQTLLQSTADAAALAGVMSLPDEGDAVTQALDYAANNMAQDHNGTVLTEQDVVIGTWDFDSETFESPTADPNAVFVTTRRARQNNNPVIMNFLRIMALWGLDPRMDVVAEAVAVKGVHKCHNNGIIAGGEFDVTTHMHFLHNICLIGHEQFHFNPHTTFDDGVYVGVGCSEGTNQCIGPGGQQQFDNEDFRTAFSADVSGAGGNYEDFTAPTLAEKTAELTNMLLDMAKSGQTFESFTTNYELENTGIDVSGYDYLADSSNNVSYATLPALPSDPSELSSYTVYEYTGSCGGDGLMLPEGPYTNLAIVTDCKIRFDSNSSYTMSDVLIATRATGEHAVHAPGQVDFGATTCGAGVEIYSYGEVFMAAAANIANLRILALDDVQFAAQSSGAVGVHIETTGDFKTASGSNNQSGGGGDQGGGQGGGNDSEPGAGGIGEPGAMGLCPNEYRNGAKVWSYALVR